MQQVAPPVGNLRLMVPLSLLHREEVSHVVDHVVREVLIEDDHVSRPLLLAHGPRPDRHPHVLDVDADGVAALVLQAALNGRSQDLAELLENAPAKSMLLLEDVDAIFVERAAAADKQGGRSCGGISFSGLFNALDSAAAQEGW